ncbi:hypothetical protein FKP32DRAFT_1224737 [Trametes sanguinea]|nr:hypothetical protein FKP32DRAFT_1224737 [Trametes sanguinea]
MSSVSTPDKQRGPISHFQENGTFHRSSSSVAPLHPLSAAERIVPSPVSRIVRSLVRPRWLRRPTASPSDGSSGHSSELPAALQVVTEERLSYPDPYANSNGTRLSSAKSTMASPRAPLPSHANRQPRDYLSNLPAPALRLIFAHLHHAHGLALAATCRALNEWRPAALATLRFPAGRGHPTYTQFVASLLDDCAYYFMSDPGRIVSHAVKAVHVYDEDETDGIWLLRTPPNEEAAETDGEGDEDVDEVDQEITFPYLNEQTVPTQPPSSFYLSSVHDIDRALCHIIQTCRHIHSFVVDARSAGPLRAWSIPLTFQGVIWSSRICDLALLNVSVPSVSYLDQEGNWRIHGMRQSLQRAVIRGGKTPYHGERARPHRSPAAQGSITIQMPRPQRLSGAYFDRQAEMLARDDLQMGKRINWVPAFVLLGEYMSLLDVEETFAGVWPGQTEDGGSGGGQWVRMVRKANCGLWKSLKVVNIKTEQRLLQFYQDFISAGTSQNGWSQVESLSLDTQLNADTLAVLVDCLPRMSLRRLRFVVHPGDGFWQTALDPSGVLRSLLPKLSLLEEVIIDCPWDVTEIHCGRFPDALAKWAAAVALAPQLKTLTVAEALVAKPTSGDIAEFKEEDSGHSSSLKRRLFNVLLNGTDTAHSVFGLNPRDRLEIFARELFGRLSANRSASLREVVFLPERSFWAKCTARAYRKGQKVLTSKALLEA